MIAPDHSGFSLTREYAAAFGEQLSALRNAGGIQCALLVDRAGRILARDGEPDGVDLVPLCTLVAAEFSANEQLAQLVGDSGFRTLLHRGERTCVDVESVDGRALLVALYDSATPAGLVRRAAERSAGELTKVLRSMIAEQPADSVERRTLFAGAEAEIDRMFES